MREAYANATMEREEALSLLREGAAVELAAAVRDPCTLSSSAWAENCLADRSTFCPARREFRRPAHLKLRTSLRDCFQPFYEDSVDGGQCTVHG